MPDYQRRLPHEQPDGQALFLTWHLQGSLPHARYPPPGKVSSGRAFVWMDRYLDTTREGPHHLKIPEIAQIVVSSILFAEERLDFYRLDSYVVMSNHVHLLVEPRVAASRLLKSIKGYSAREANRFLGLTGARFWQSESYDRWVRNDEEQARIRNYIHRNPVKAGIVASPELYRWSSAWRGD